MPGFTKGAGMGFGRGWGRGIGFGYGRGRGRVYWEPIYRNVFSLYPSGMVPKISQEDNLTILKQQKEYLELEMKNIMNTIEDISKRITEFEKEE